MKQYLIFAAIAVVVIAIVFRVSAIRSVVTGG